MAAVRTPAAVTYAVWRALFLREALFRLSSQRTAWLWLLLEPVFTVAVVMLFLELIHADRIPGVDTGLFHMSGMLGFLMTRNTMMRSMEAINANAALFAYRQVKPVDTVLMRAAVEGFLNLVVAILMLAGTFLLGLKFTIDDPLEIIVAFAGLWLLGLGLGLILSVVNELLADLANIARLASFALYFVSGVPFPATMIPPEYRYWLFLNPLISGVEAMRGGFLKHYHVVSSTSVSYLYTFALLAIFFGLALQVRYARKLIAL